MRRTARTAWAVAAAVLLGGAAMSAKATTMTGEVGDAMCGVKHMMGDDHAACTRDCVKEGSDYALIVKDKAYTLKTSDDKLKSELDKLAGKNATIAGDLDGDTIQVTSVQPAK